MKISEQDVRYVGALANLELTATETAALQRELSAILGYIDQLSELDTSGVEPLAQATVAATANAALRVDELRASLPREAALANAPLYDEGLFRVPKMIER